VALGSPDVCLEWCTARTLAAGATEDETVNKVRSSGVDVPIESILTGAASWGPAVAGNADDFIPIA
jgi:hypothetical protein